MLQRIHSWRMRRSMRRFNAQHSPPYFKQPPTGLALPSLWGANGLRPQPNLRTRGLEVYPVGFCRAYVVDFFAETSRLWAALDRVTEVSLRCGIYIPECV